MKEITHEEALKDLREIAENITSKQWQKLTSKIEHIRNYITQQEKVNELMKKLLNNIREINTPQQKHFVFLASEYQLIKYILNKLESELNDNK